MTNDTASNWGRWGAEDQRGTLNLLTEERVRQAVGLVRRGRVYSLGMDFDRSSPIAPGRSPLWHRTTFNSRPGQMGGADDIILMHTHGTTHVDALCHVFFDNRMYNGFPVDASISSTAGARRNGVHNAVSIVGRGVLLDVARHRDVDHLGKDDVIAPEELDACARAQGVELRPGDIVLIRTGWLRVLATDRALYDSGAPGPNGAAGAWFRKHDLCALGADTVAVERYPTPEGVQMHVEVIRNLGGYLLEYLDLEQIAADGVHEFLFVAAPLRLINGIGSPINPLAIC